MGCEFVSKTWGLTPEIHPIDKIVYDNFLTSVQMYQLRGTSTPPEPHCTLSEGDTIRFGVTQFKVHFVPGHSPGHVAFECAQSGFVIVGDVLFQRSIGRTDLPGGNFETLIQSIKNVLFKLDLNLKVYCGHGDETTLLEEKMHNPFLVN
jgi:glyoxylase-like metal-dependent hydrolase (beta-lactamase superfamily II)